VIEARHFVEAARERGFEWYAGVPCSYLTPFINYVLQEPSLHYVSMANEGDAVALIAGVALAGTPGGGHRRGIAMMQNSGLGNAVSPLTSLTWTFRLPQLLIVTWRGQPGVPDEPQHALMGPITPTMLDTMEIRWELFPTDAAAIGPALDRAVAHMDATGRPYALVMQKGSVANYPLKPGADAINVRSSRASTIVQSGQVAPAARVSRQEALREVVKRTGSAAVLASTGFCGRELYAVEDRANHLYMVGSMGCVVPLGLGLALARPDLRVVALDGDGAALMRMGAFATVGAYGPPNLWHLLLDNGAHVSTGGQATVSPNVSFAEIAAACGYASALDTDSLGIIAEWLDGAPLDGPRFARLLTRPGTPADLPRPAITPVDVKTRLMQHLGPQAVTERDRAASEGIPSGELARESPVGRAP
jgi:phosphonopyruvate decarboxylase